MISPPPDSDLRRRMTIPNALTLLRILLVPVFGLLWLADHHLAALIVFLVAGGTDLLDGLLARTLNQRTRLGSLLDPAADKLTLLVAFLVGVSTGGVPAWLAALVIGRDLVLTLGVGIYTLVVHGAYRSWHPTRLGKYSTFYQLATIAAALLARGLEHREDRKIHTGSLLVYRASHARLHPSKAPATIASRARAARRIRYRTLCSDSSLRPSSSSAAKRCLR